ncbi:TPA: hypothetical protein I4D22_24275, partial [Enterobacter asburiae]|nr:hypothetical protein [Enterobacter asburiae]
GKQVNFPDIPDYGKRVNFPDSTDCGKQVNFPESPDYGKAVNFRTPRSVGNRSTRSCNMGNTASSVSPYVSDPLKGR